MHRITTGQLRVYHDPRFDKYCIAFGFQNAGLSLELREQGYGLMCVGYPLTDCVLETVPEDEIYNLQFGEAIKVSRFGLRRVCFSSRMNTA